MNDAYYTNLYNVYGMNDAYYTNLYNGMNDSYCTNLYNVYGMNDAYYTNLYNGMNDAYCTNLYNVYAYHLRYFVCVIGEGSGNMYGRNMFNCEFHFYHVTSRLPGLYDLNPYFMLLLLILNMYHTMLGIIKF